MDVLVPPRVLLQHAVEEERATRKNGRREPYCGD